MSYGSIRMISTIYIDTGCPSMLFSPVFVKPNQHTLGSPRARSAPRLSSFASFSSFVSFTSSNSLRLNLFADHHPLTLLKSYLFKNREGLDSVALPCSSFQSSRDGKLVTASPLLPSLTNRDACNSFRIRSYANYRVSPVFFPKKFARSKLHIPQLLCLPLLCDFCAPFR